MYIQGATVGMSSILNEYREMVSVDIEKIVGVIRVMRTLANMSVTGKSIPNKGLVVLEGDTSQIDRYLTILVLQMDAILKAYKGEIQEHKINNDVILDVDGVNIEVGVLYALNDIFITSYFNIDRHNKIVDIHKYGAKIDIIDGIWHVVPTKRDPIEKKTLEAMKTVSRKYDPLMPMTFLNYLSVVEYLKNNNGINDECDIRSLEYGDKIIKEVQNTIDKGKLSHGKR